MKTVEVIHITFKWFSTHCSGVSTVLAEWYGFEKAMLKATYGAKMFMITDTYITVEPDLVA